MLTNVYNSILFIGVYDEIGDFVHGMFLEIEKVRLEYFKKEQSTLRRKLFQSTIGMVTAEKC